MGDRRHLLGSVRLRTTIAATTVVGAALVVGAILLVGVLRRNLVDNVRTATQLRADDVVTLLEEGAAPRGIAVEDEEASLVQVVDRRGRVVAASGNIERESVAIDAPLGPSRVSDLPIDGEGPYQVVTETAATPAGPYLVIAARSLEPAQDSIQAVAATLATGLPILVALVAVTTWVVMARALRPVEAMRSEVTEITNRALERRVPEPRGNDEIARLARTMNEMLGRLQDSRDRQRRFVSDASHELRSPIATIRHELEVLIANPTTIDVSAVAADLLAEDLRMEALVENLLVLARLDEPNHQPDRRPVDLDDLVLAEARRLRGRGVVRVEAVAVSGGQVLGDRGQLGRVVRNLVDNAERHAASTVRLSLTTDGQVVRLSVDDDGPGIPAQDRARVFERFTRLDAARSRDRGGYGLGLAIVQEVVTGHGGATHIEESSQGGTNVVVELPVAPG